MRAADTVADQVSISCCELIYLHEINKMNSHNHSVMTDSNVIIVLSIS